MAPDPEAINLTAAATETHVRTEGDVAVPSGETVPDGAQIDSWNALLPEVGYESPGPATSAGQELPVTVTAEPSLSVPVQPLPGDIMDLPEPLTEDPDREMPGPGELAVTHDSEILPETTQEMPTGPVPPEESPGMAEPEPVRKKEPPSRTGFFSMISGSLRDRFRKSGK